MTIFHIHILCRMTTPDQKLKWIFNVFDKDGGGTIDAEEISEMVRGLFSMSGIEVDEDEVENSTREILQAVDVDDDGDITMVILK